MAQSPFRTGSVINRLFEAQLKEQRVTGHRFSRPAAVLPKPKAKRPEVEAAVCRPTPQDVPLQQPWLQLLRGDVDVPGLESLYSRSCSRCSAETRPPSVARPRTEGGATVWPPGTARWRAWELLKEKEPKAHLSHDLNGNEMEMTQS